ncbi:efflux RND transporter periplasmic adaptor subunit [Fulvivirga lutimaris]|uniref:efflux RND transporter periplasmic adaptor subunit n=1 Tax=Fulvivirga lutimaris TaxID=1819566 RepID=UPI0012BD193B|nr:efflux RND transporter periplasmic adaptor subunit [Fulvivirga lutimaris]MTI41625.1 efflux RND transporter periplasmic adaptor subunit [Fulvivirga lutimaris]
MKTINYLTILIILLTVFACGSDDQHTIADTKAVAVKVAKASSQSMGSTIGASGTIEAKNSTNLSTRMMGFVTSLPVKVGQKVKKGQLLISINNADLNAKKAQVEASITQAQSALENAEKDYNRFKALFDKNSASQKELDDMTTRFEMAKANYEAASQMKKEVLAQYAYSNITAPFDGVVTNTFIKEGGMANPGMPLVALEGGKQYEAAVMISENDISKLKQEAKAKVLVKSLGKEFTGTVTEISKSAKNTAGQYIVKVSLEEPTSDVYAGMFVNVSFSETTESQKGITMNKSAIVSKGQLSGVYVVSSEKVAILRWLRLGKTIGGDVEVLSGLKPGETYISSADGKLYNGAKVTF